MDVMGMLHTEIDESLLRFFAHLFIHHLFEVLLERNDLPPTVCDIDTRDDNNNKHHHDQ